MLLLDISNIEWTGIIVAMVSTIGGLFSVITKFGGDYVLKKLELRETQRKEEALKKSVGNIEREIINHSQVDTICKEIKDFIKASKCNVWMFHNGGYFFTGSDIQKVSMVAGVTDNASEDLKVNFTNIPIGVFSRNLTKLIKEDYTHERNELAYSDTLAVLNAQFDVTSSALFKLKSVDKKDWVGLLAIGWLNHNELTEKEIEFINEKLVEISRLLSPKLLKIK